MLEPVLFTTFSSFFENIRAKTGGNVRPRESSSPTFVYLSVSLPTARPMRARARAPVATQRIGGVASPRAQSSQLVRPSSCVFLWRSFRVSRFEFCVRVNVPYSASSSATPRRSVFFPFPHPRLSRRCTRACWSLASFPVSEFREQTDRETTTTGAMRLSWVFAAAVLLVLATGVRCKRKFDGDFEFAEEVSAKRTYLD